MRTYPTYWEESGEIRSFDVEIGYLTIEAIVGILSGVPGVSQLARKRLFRRFLPDCHVTFQFRGEMCIVWEPWGDSSEYWIGPDDGKNSKLVMTEVHAAFVAYQPGPVMNLLGNLVHLHWPWTRA